MSNLWEEVNYQPDGFMEPDNLLREASKKASLWVETSLHAEWYDIVVFILLISNDLSKGLRWILPISQSPEASLYTQSKYALESLRNIGFESCDPGIHPCGEVQLDEEKEARPDLQFAIMHGVPGNRLATAKHLNAGHPSDTSVCVFTNEEGNPACAQQSNKLFMYDINQKFLRSLPPSWNQIALIMRNKPDIDEIDIDDLYNNLRVYKDEMKRSSSSTPTSQNLVFLSSENTSSTNEVSTANGDLGVSTAGGTSQVPSTLCAHDIDGDDLEELDLRWHVAMLTVKVKKFRRNQGRRSYGDNGRSNAPTNESSSQSKTRNFLNNEISLSVFDVRSSDEESTPVNDMLSKADGYHAVPPPITRNFLTPRADISFVGLDEYAIRKKIIESKTTELNADTSKSKTSETVVRVQNMTTAGTRAVVNTGKGKMDTDLKKSRCGFGGLKEITWINVVQRDSETFMLKRLRQIQRSCYKNHALWIVVALKPYD
ncbi:hypothetical protein Tco_0169699 [Tanacetum coccineum]